ncbi:MAG: hypothetical protein JWR86_2198 [Enterovirga sp.]|nr:hypothetical protein [Enterovirga sp.]
MLVAMVTFGANFAVSRYAVQHGLTAYDLVFLRFGIAGSILLPFFLQRGLRDCAGIGWGRGTALALTSGATVTLLMSLGVTYAPAAHGAALGPGTVTVVGVVYATVLAGRLPPGLTRIGLVLVLAGLLVIAVAGTTASSPDVLLGDGFFFLTGLLWGFYPVLLHRWRVGGMVGAAVCAVLSLVYVPVYFAFLEPRLLQVPLGVVLVQAVYQGVCNSIIALWLWGHGIKHLGAAGTQLFPPMIPVIGALAAVPILGEWPGPLQSLAIAMIVAGLAFSAYGNRLRSLERPSS